MSWASFNISTQGQVFADQSRLLPLRAFPGGWIATIAIGLALLSGCGESSPPGVTLPLGESYSSSSAPTPVSTPPAIRTNSSSAESASQPGVPAPIADNTAAATQASQSVSQERYQQRLARDAVRQAKIDISQQFGQRYVTITIHGVPGPAAEADHYIERKLFKAAYEDYARGAKQADTATEANRQAAQQRLEARMAQANAQNQIGSIWMEERYQKVRNDVPYPAAKGGEVEPGTHVYYVGPVSDPGDFARRISFGEIQKTDVQARELQVSSQIPSPIPDIDLEEMILQHGKERLVTIRLLGFDGKSDPAMFYLEQQVTAIRSGYNWQLASVGPKPLPDGEYRLYMAPAGTTKEIAARIRFGEVTDTDPITRQITVNVKLPENLPERPSAANLTTQQEIAAMNERLKPAKMRVSDGNEDELALVLQVLNDGVTVIVNGKHVNISEALTLLQDLVVPEDKKDEVGKALVACGEGTWGWHNSDKLLKLMDEYCTPDVMEFIYVTLHEQHWDKTKLFRFILRHPSQEGAEAVAAMMTDRWAAEEASRTLRKMGEVAEPVVMKLSTDFYVSMRVEAYDILSEIGTEAGYLKLRSLLPKERDKLGKERLKAAISSLEDRLGPERVAELKSKGVATPKSSSSSASGKTPGKSTKPAKSK